MKQYDAGVNGELAAEQYLCQLGMCVAARRYRAAGGEIDLIMLDRETVVFVEVKARRNSSRGTGLAAITPAKIRRISHAALGFLIEKEWTDYPVRFDVIEISRDGILHIPNAFVAPE